MNSMRAALRSAPLFQSISYPIAYSAKRFTSTTMADKVVHVHNGAEYDTNIKKSGLVCTQRAREGEEGWSDEKKGISPLMLL